MKLHDRADREVEEWQLDDIRQWLDDDIDEDADADADEDGVQLRDRSFNPWRVALTDKANDIIGEAVRMVEHYEAYKKLRSRKRKANDQETFTRTIEAVLCDLMHHRLFKRDHGIHVSRSNRKLGKSRYRNPVYSKAFPGILGCLSSVELGWINQTIGASGKPSRARKASKAQSAIYPGPRLIDRMDALGIALGDLGIIDLSDPIELRYSKDDRRKHGTRMEYDDTELTRTYRHQMDQINSWLGKADLFVNLPSYATPKHDPAQRKLKRYFTQGDLSFASGGRLYGGFWQTMSKADRFETLLIDDEDCVELDYGQMGLRIAYGSVGIDPGPDDLYNLPGLEVDRDGVKKVINAMLAADKRLTQMPQGTRKHFPKTLKFVAIRDAIEERHRDIQHLFYVGHVHAIMFAESQLMVHLLLRLKDAGITALPIHDALLVADSRKMDAKAIMLETFRDRVGIPGSVTVNSTDEETGQGDGEE